MDIQATLSVWTEELTLSLSDTSSFGIALFSKNGELLFVNAAMTKLCSDFNSNSFLNPTFEKLSSTGSTESMVFSGFLTIGNYNHVNTSIEAKVFQKNDNYLVVGGVNVSDLIEQNKTMHHLNQTVNNLQRELIKEKKTLQDTFLELKETQQMLIHSEKMNAMGNLVAGVAHELNNPISFVYSNLFSLENYIAEVFEAYSAIENLIQGSNHATLQEAVATIRKKMDLDFLQEDITDMTKESKLGIERIKTIIEDLRRFSRLDEAEVKRVNLLENIQSTLTILRQELTRKEIRFTMTVPDIQLECFPGQFNQALMNIMINAIHAVEVKGNIDLNVEEKEDSIQLTIKDNGCGIPKEIIPRIFEPFFTTKPVGVGTGLGLSITYKIIHDLHHGSIEVISEVGSGSSFIITLPKKVPL